MAYGFIPIGGIDGRPYNGATKRCVVVGGDTTDIYPGDFVRYTGTGDDFGAPSVTKVAAGEVIFGAVVSVEPNVASGDRTYVLGSVTTDQYVNVAIATDGMLFKCNPSAAAAKTSIGLNADISVTAGAAPYYTSKSSLDVGATGTATAQLNIVGFLDNGTALTSTSADLVVRVAEPQIGAATLSVGV